MRWLINLVGLFAAVEAATAVEPAVTAADLADRERLWPYRVTLVEPWQPPGSAEPLSPGTLGVLIRIERSGAARVDFSGDGKFEVPVDKTDLVANANRIRSGEVAKQEPNFTHAIATRLLDPGADRLAGVELDRVANRPGFLCVFADPEAKGFDDLARALRELADRNQVLTILFPQGPYSDDRIRERLRKLEWSVPFVYDFLAEPYTRTLLPDASRFPFVLLQTNEGRVIHQGTFESGTVSSVRTALDAAFAAATPAPSEK